MDRREKFREKMIALRKSTGMNRKEFCEYFGIPYDTEICWENGRRTAPDYFLRLLEYYIRMEGLVKNNPDHEQSASKDDGNEL